MPLIYEAEVTTDDGTFRAFRVTSTAICVTQDGHNGVIDYIWLDETDQLETAPENLVQILIEWIFEIQRGITVLTGTLTCRGA